MGKTANISINNLINNKNNMLKAGALAISYEIANNKMKIKISNPNNTRNASASIPLADNVGY